jgi:mono/diheme cytochrome c family protein
VIISDMDRQPKVKPEAPSSFFADGRAMRPLVEGVVAQGELREDDALYRGRVGEAYVQRAPIPVDEVVLTRGQQRFNIYCAPCHDKAGSGRGMVVRHGFPPPVDLASERVRTMPDGEIFETITNGVRNMPSYRKQVPVLDRWAIVTWLRVLGHSQHAALADVPTEAQGHIDAESGMP